MANEQYGSDDHDRHVRLGRNPPIRDDRYDREERGYGQDRLGGRENHLRESRSFSAGAGDPYGDYGQDYGSDRYRPEGPGYRAGPGRRPDQAGSEGRYRAEQGRPLGGENPMLVDQAAGQSGPHRGRGPKNYVRSDERIREDVSDRLADHAHLDASEIDVQVQNGEVTLSGTVDDRMSKRRAEDCADDVSGVKHVQNNLRVKAADSATTAFGAAAAGNHSRAG
jgi:hypothetical protein